MPLQATSGAASYDAFGGGVPVVPTYIEDIFSCFLYTGNGSTQTITNGIDLAGEGGLVWLKCRNSAENNEVYDTVRGANQRLITNTTGAQVDRASSMAFSSTGLSWVGDNISNTNGNTYASWTFRKQPKFFDVVTYTGTGSVRTVAHSLGSTPGCIIVKRTDASNGWAVYHRAMNASPQDYMMRLNATDGAFTTTPSRWNNTLPTSTEFTLSGNDEVNGSGATYVAYLFAHDAGGFGLTGTDNVISCGSFTTDGSGYGSVTLGYEPQWILMKDTQSSTIYDNWYVIDNMRGFLANGNANELYANKSDAENANVQRAAPTATGFIPQGLNASKTYIYIAIRRGPMKVPTSGTSVFSPVTQTGGSFVTTNFPVDSVISTGRTNPSAVGGIAWLDRLRGSSIYSVTSSTAAEINAGSVLYGWNNSNIGYQDYAYASTGASGIYWNMRRAPSFFDEVCYTGNGAGASQVNNHNLGVVPELIISKKRSATGGWVTWATGLSGSTYYLQLNATDGEYNGGATLFRSSTQYTWYWGDNVAGATYVTYLFASCPGISKVGSYSGTGSTQTISCGFTGGARWVMVKRIDVDGYGWYVWDTARGMVSGTDPSLLLNSTAAEVNANSIYTTTGGFQIVSTAAGINASGGSYIFFAVA